MENLFKPKEIVSFFSDPIQITLMLVLATILGMVISWTYHRTHRGFSFSQNFANTIIIMTVITTFIIMIIGDNVARAIGIFGAFSIVRFRTSMKDTRDTAFVFFALAAGLGVGTGSLSIAITGTLLISALIFFLHFGNFAGPKKLDYVLNFRMDAKDHDQGIFKSVLTKYVKSEILLNVDSKEKGKELAFTFNISLKKDSELNLLVNELMSLNGVSKVNIVSSKSDLEF